MYMMVYLLPFVTVGLFHKLGTLADADRLGGRRAGRYERPRNGLGRFAYRRRRPFRRSRS